MGLVTIALVLVSIALTNLLTKADSDDLRHRLHRRFFAIFTISERINRRKLDSRRKLDQFQLQHNETVDLHAWARGRATCWSECATTTRCHTWSTRWTDKHR